MSQRCVSATPALSQSVSVVAVIHMLDNAGACLRHLIHGGLFPQ